MKNVFLVVVIICFVAGVFLNFKTSSEKGEDNFSLSTLMLSQAGGEDHCVNRPGENTGKCRSNVQGGYNCVDSYWFEWNDCIY